MVTKTEVKYETRKGKILFYYHLTIEKSLFDDPPSTFFVADNVLKVRIFPFHILCAWLQVCSVTSSFMGRWELNIEFCACYASILLSRYFLSPLPLSST